MPLPDGSPPIQWPRVLRRALVILLVGLALYMIMGLLIQVATGP